MVAIIAVMPIGITLTKPVSIEDGKNIALPENALLMHDRNITSAAMAAHHLMQCSTRDDLQFDDFSHSLMSSIGL